MSSRHLIRFDELGRIADVISDLAASFAGGAPRPPFRRPAWFITPE